MHHYLKVVQIISVLRSPSQILVITSCIDTLLYGHFIFYERTEPSALRTSIRFLDDTSYLHISHEKRS